MVRLIDISPLVHEEIAVFPGDTPFGRSILLDMREGDHLTLSAMTATVHVGAHADAPSHYVRDGADIASRALDFYIGTCDVVRVDGAAGRRIMRDDLPPDRTWSERVLFRTDSFPDPSRWIDSFASLSAGLIEFLAREGVRLVGIDTPSIDPADSKELEAHQAAARHDMAILEGLVLTDVPEGTYELIAPPLKIAGGDAAPVRAVLRVI